MRGDRSSTAATPAGFYLLASSAALMLVAGSLSYVAMGACIAVLHGRFVVLSGDGGGIDQGMEQHLAALNISVAAEGDQKVTLLRCCVFPPTIAPNDTASRNVTRAARGSDGAGESSEWHDEVGESSKWQEAAGESRVGEEGKESIASRQKADSPVTVRCRPPQGVAGLVCPAHTTCSCSADPSEWDYSVAPLVLHPQCTCVVPDPAACRPECSAAMVAALLPGRALVRRGSTGAVVALEIPPLDVDRAMRYQTHLLWVTACVGFMCTTLWLSGGVARVDSKQKLLAGVVYGIVLLLLCSEQMQSVLGFRSLLTLADFARAFPRSGQCFPQETLYLFTRLRAFAFAASWAMFATLAIVMTAALMIWAVLAAVAPRIT